MSTEAPAPSVDLVIVEKNPQVVALVKQTGIEADTAHSLMVAYSPFFGEVDRLLAEARGCEVTDATQVTMIKKSRELRLKLREQRVAADKKREELKADSLRRGNAVQGLYNLLRYMVEPIEERLLAAELFAERAEAARLEKRQAERFLLLGPYGIDVSFFDLRNMPDEAFQRMLAGTKAAFEEAQATKKKIAEEEMAKAQAEAAERARIRDENERLRAEQARLAAVAEDERRKVREAETLAAQQKAEYAKREREARERTEREIAEIRKKNAEAAEAERKEREKVEAAHQKQREAEARLQKLENDARLAELKKKADEEAAARKKIEDEQQAKAIADKLHRDDLEAAARALAVAPDKDKLRAFCKILHELPLPELSSPAGEKISVTLSVQHLKYAEWILKQAESL